MMRLVLTIIILYYLVKDSTFAEDTFHVNSTTGLHNLLCENKIFTKNTTILLDTSINHQIQYNGFCQITGNDTATLTITSSSDHQYAVIECNSARNTAAIGTAGFFFQRLHKLALIRLVFDKCGSSFQNSSHLINSLTTRFNFSLYRHGAMLMTNAINIVNIQQITISHYFGFALIARNIPVGKFANVSILQNFIGNHSNKEHGSGMLMMYEDDTGIIYKNRMMLNISKSIFQNNDIFYPNAKCLPEEYLPERIPSKHAMITGSAITIIYSQYLFNVSTVVSECIFANNSGYPIENILIMYLNDIMGSEFIMKNDNMLSSSFISSNCGGSLLYIFIHESRTPSLATNNGIVYAPIVISNTWFKFDVDKPSDLQANGIQLLFKTIRPLLIHFKQLRFIQSKNKGVLLKAIANAFMFKEFNVESLKSVKIKMESIIALNNKANGLLTMSTTGSFIFHNIQNVLIVGDKHHPSVFNKLLGPIINAINTDVTLQGVLTFIEASSIKGGGICIHNGVLYLKNELVSYFAELKARRKGGAIYISDNTVTQSGRKNCSIQIAEPVDSVNMTMRFEYNQAMDAGSAVFITNLYRCYMGGTWIDTTSLVYEKSFNFTQPPRKTVLNNIRNISTTPKQIHVCHPLDSQKKHYPGEAVTLGINSVDFSNNSVYAKIGLFLIYNRSLTGAGEKTYWKLKYEDRAKIIQENVKNNCTMISVTILGDNKGILTGHRKEIVVYISDDTQITIPVKIEADCPLGFELHTTHYCECSKLLNQILTAPKCNITSRMLPFISQGAWIGSNKEGNFSLVLFCNIYHCKTITKTYSFMIENSTTFISDTKNTVEICHDHRTGIACSECQNGTTAAFGTHKCIHCSNWWITTLILYLIAGPLLIYLLFTFKLTLTIGTLNGILTYGHLSNGYLSNSLRQQSIDSYKHNSITQQLADFGHAFLSMLNLNLGFSVCFYDGMSEIWKSGLSLLFPLYLVIIVIALIVASRYSTSFSNRTSHLSVQVMVTVVHLSFSKLLLAIFDVLSSTEIHVESLHYSIFVWRNDARVTFGSYEHLILVLITIVVACMFIVPYTVVLSMGVLLMKQKCIRSYLRPYYEAIHGPYKNNKEYWFALRNFMVVIVTVVSAVLNGQNQFLENAIVIPIVLVFLVLQAYNKPYKNNILNILDIAILLNYEFVISTTWYYHVTTEIWKSKLLTSIMVMILFVIFLSIISYHISISYSKTRKFTKTICSKFCRKKSDNNHPEMHLQDDDDDDNQLREPLLEP